MDWKTSKPLRIDPEIVLNSLCISHRQPCCFSKFVPALYGSSHTPHDSFVVGYQKAVADGMKIVAFNVAEFDFARYQLLPITLCASYIGVCSLRLVRCPRFFLSWGSAFPRCGNTDGYQGCKFSLFQVQSGIRKARNSICVGGGGLSVKRSINQEIFFTLSHVSQCSPFGWKWSIDWPSPLS